MFDFLSQFKNQPKVDNRQFKNSLDKIFENAKDDKISVVSPKYSKTKTISKKDFFKIMSI
ncbi:MAG: hypothetical protein OIF32_03770 [Campylobacterales bacterium]|nr:hypothetical protein [Campylobacterales bacterium]